MTAGLSIRALSLLVVLLLWWTAASVWGSETVPAGVERIGAQAVWDKNYDKAIDNGGNAGDGVGIAVIDSGLWNDSNGEYPKRPSIEAVYSFLKTQYSLGINKVRELGNVAVYVLHSMLSLVLTREAAENLGRPDKAISPTYNT